MVVAPVFLGFESLDLREKSSDPDSGGSDLSRQLDRLMRQLAENELDSASILSLELFVESNKESIEQFSDEILRELGVLLAPETRPVVSIIPVASLGSDSAVKVQAVVMPGCTVTSAIGERFPASAVAGGMFASVSNPADSEGTAAAQQSKGMAFLRDEVNKLGADIADVIHINFFYLIEGTRDEWQEEASVRSEIFSDPGPCATGIPIEYTSQSGGTMQLIAYGEVGSREVGKITDAWPESPWVWPFPLPYRHGNKLGTVVFVGGQSSTDIDPVLSASETLASHTEIAFRKVEAVLEELKSTAKDLVRLTAYYVVKSDSDEQTIRTVLATLLDGHVIELSLIGVAALAHPGMVVEIDGQAIAVP